MRRVLGIAAVLAVSGALIVLATGASNGTGGAYKVRAIFQNAFSLVPGEDVKIAGVKVGKIDSLDVTDDQKAAVVLNITKAGFDDFRQDAECTIRPQSLIGEKFVECTPTQPRAPDQQVPPPLKKIEKGEGEGQYLLPVTNTSRPVDIDLVNNIMRLPYRQRLGIIINEFGTALAGRGEDLRSVIRNADPALKATDKLLNLLASQDKVLADLAEQSDIALAPLARDRRHVANFVQHAADLATATADRRGAFRAQFQKLPAFLRELRPTMTRLSQFADQATPVFASLRPVAPSVSRLIKATGPFSSSSTVALKSLGEASVPGRKALIAARPIISDLRMFAATAKPLAKGLAGITTSLHDTGGIERLMDYIFYQVAAINGYDEFGHYLRASLILNLCSQYAVTRDPACTANFQNTGQASAASASNMTAMQALHAPGMDLTWRRTAAVLRGMSPAEAIRLTKGEEDPQPAQAPAEQQSATQQQPQQEQQSAVATTATNDTNARLLDYLLGGQS
jgi:ABC-type transporter Mla subunit MlaD